LRALLVRLDAWATSGESPPSSAVPRRDDETLVNAEDVLQRFPTIGDMRPPHELNRLFEHDYGPSYGDGITATESPRLDMAHEYLGVPGIDADGNDIPGLRNFDIEVPRATYTGWNHRGEAIEPKAMYSIVGGYLSFAATKADREAT
jgi:hypothetical protein